MNVTRNGKIARLPHSIAAGIEPRLDDGEQGEDARRVAHVFPFVPAKAAADLDFVRRHSRFMPSEHFDDKPKSLSSSAARIARLAELRDPHIAPLTAFVDTLRAQMGSDYRIAYFDPWDGGVAAEVLYLLEAPGAEAVVSGFISRNNPDETAKNFFQLNQQSGSFRRRTITWNIVPWYIGSG